MIKILSTKQIREADEHTIKNEPISSYELMERASQAFVKKFDVLFTQKKQVRVFCGIGNNGGDGLAIGRLLREEGWNVLKYVIGNPRKGTEDFKHNLDKSDLYAVIKSVEDLPQIGSNEIIIDALFGSGLSRDIEGIYKETLSYLNEQSGVKVSVDMPSGLYGDKPIGKDAIVFAADHTISFELPKLAFLLPDCYAYVGDWHVVDIGLSQSFIEKQPSGYCFTEKSDVGGLLPKRRKFTHKSEVGKLTVVAGSKGKIGAAILTTRAALRAGVGLINVCCPKIGTSILHSSVPEAMVLESDTANYIGKVPKLEDTLVLGPGLGTHPKTISGLASVLEHAKKPLVIDADGINALAKKRELLKLLPKDSILTPHPGEFRRLVGETKDDFDRLEKLISFCKEYKVNMVLKGAYSIICSKRGDIFFNSTGNPVLATAGSGDVLSGIIGAFLASGLLPLEALKLGVFVHGYCGDLLAAKTGGYGVVASDIVEVITEALLEISQ